MNPLALTVGYTHNGNGYDARTFQSSGEDVFRVSADAVGTNWATFRAAIRGRQPHRIGPGRAGPDRHRRAPGDAAVRPGRPDEKPLHRAGRHRPVGRLDVQRLRRSPARRLPATPSSGCRSRPGAPSRSPPTTTCRTALARVPPTTTSGMTGLQQSHEGDSSAAQFNDPLRNWTADSTETVNYFSIYATPPRIGRNTEVRFSYDFSHANGNYLYTIPVGSPITTPNQLPDVFNKLQQLHIDARHRMTKNLAATFSYLYEPFRRSTTSRSIPASSTASSSPARWSWATSTVPTPRIPLCSASDISGKVGETAHVVCGGSMHDDEKSSGHDRARVCRCDGDRAPGCGAGRGAIKHGAGSLHRAEVPDLPRHRRQRQQEPTRSTASARSCPPTTSASGS